MSHQVHTMAYQGQTPWHGLGNQLTPNQPLEIWAKQAGMDWSIESSPVQFIKGQHHLGTRGEYPDKRVLYRSDNHLPLSVVSPRYKVVQPLEILEFYRDLTEHAGFELETAGVLKEGRKLWALARTGQSMSLASNDITHGYVLLATACDGTMATTAQFTSVRVVCNNTLAIALNKGEQAIKVRHSTDFDSNKVKQQLGIAVSGWDDFQYRMKTLSHRSIKSTEAHRFIDQVLTTNSSMLTASSKSLDRNKAQILSLYEGGGRGSDLNSANGTAFGLLNAVTEYVDHSRRARTADNRLDSAWFGQGASIKQTAFSEAMALVA